MATRGGLESSKSSGGGTSRGGGEESRASTAADRRGTSQRSRESLGGAFGSFEGENVATGRADFARSREEQSTFGKALQNKLDTFVDKAVSPTGIGGLLGGLFGPALGLDPATGAKLGTTIGGLFDDDDEKAGTESTVSTAATREAQAEQQAQSLGVPASSSAQQQFSRLGAGLPTGGAEESRVAQVQAPQAQPVTPQQQVASGIQQPGLAPQNFLNQSGVLPLVNISAFPGALGRA